MNRRDRLDALLQKRLQALMQDLPSARQGDPEALHRTRVASRRVREALPLVTEATGGKLTRIRRSTRRITRTLGRVREMDVALDLLGRIQPAEPHERIALERVRERLTHQRDRRREEMRERLTGLRPDRVVKKIEGRLEERRTAGDENESWRDVLSARLQRRAARLVKAINRAGELYVPDRLHAVRIATKKLRYALELAGEAREGPTARAVRTLKQVQDALGQLHDYHVLEAHVQEVQASLDSRQSEALDGVVRSLGARCRTLHARYAARREEIRRICAEAEDFPRRVWPLKPSHPSTAADG